MNRSFQIIQISGSVYLWHPKCILAGLEELTPHFYRECFSTFATKNKAPVVFQIYIHRNSSVRL